MADPRDTSFNAKNYAKDSATMIIGGVLDVADGGSLKMGGNVVNFRAGQHSTVAAVDTIITGLKTVAAVIVSMDDDPSDDPEWVSATIGDQAGSPAAGSFNLKSWKNTSGTDPTPVAATTFSKKVNWIAIGT